MKKNKKNKIIIIVIIAVVFCILICNKLVKNDNMSQNGVYNIKYKTCISKKKKCDSWVKNGRTSGNTQKDIYIVNFDLKIKQSNKISYRIYSKENGWSKDLLPNETIENQTITAIDMDIYKNLKNKYDICYRTYNKKDKWLGWSCNGEISGNKKEKINAIQIKIIPKNVILEEYLKDYDPTTVNNKNF